MKGKLILIAATILGLFLYYISPAHVVIETNQEHQEAPFKPQLRT